MTSSKILVPGLTICLFVMGCSGNNKEVDSDISTGYSIDKKISQDDKSVSKCISDGYDVEPVEKYGVASSYNCINPKKNLTCDSWAYYRGECKLG